MMCLHLGNMPDTVANNHVSQFCMCHSRQKCMTKLLRNYTEHKFTLSCLAWLCRCHKSVFKPMHGYCMKLLAWHAMVTLNVPSSAVVQHVCRQSLVYLPSLW